MIQLSAWNFVSEALEVFNFGPVIRKLLLVLYNDMESAAYEYRFPDKLL